MTKKVNVKVAELIINENENPRNFYGNEEEWETFKGSIKDVGYLKQNIEVCYDKTAERYKLTHGFRRLRAIKEILKEAENGEYPKLIELEANLVEDNKIENLLNHYRMNTGLPMSDIEKAEGMLLLEKLTGETNMAELARMVNITYQKAVMLMDFIRKAGSQVKNAVNTGEISFSNAYHNIIKKSGSVTEQNDILKQSREEKERLGKSKIVIKRTPKENPNKVEKLEVKIGNFIVNATLDENVDKEKLSIFKSIITNIDNNAPYNNIIELLNKI